MRTGKLTILFIGFVVALTAIGAYLYIKANQEISFDKRLPDSLEYYKYRDGVLHSKVQIAKGDDTYSLIASWFDRNKEGWKPDIRTYADNDVYSGKDIKINVLKDAVIVNYSENGNRWIQLSKSKRTGELELGE